MAFLVSRCTVIHNNKAQRACTGTTFLSRSIPGRGKRNEKCSLSDAVWRCTLLAGRCFVSFLSFIGIQQVGIQFFSFFFYSLFHFEVSIFFIDYWYRKDFLIHFLRSSIFPFRRTCCANDFEKRRILYGILYGMDFHPSLVTNEKPWNWICGQWGKSGRVPTTMRYVWKLGRGGEGGNDRPFGKLASENESSIGYALHCSWQLVALLAGGDKLGSDEKEHREGGNEGKEEKGKKEEEEQKRKFTRSIWERREGGKKGKRATFSQLIIDQFHFNRLKKFHWTIYILLSTLHDYNNYNNYFE